MTVEDSPPYTPSAPSPLYSSEPSADEERLAFTACKSYHLWRTGHFRRKARHTTLILHDQDENAVVPLYENDSIVSGTIVLDGCDRVQSVVVELECQIVVNGESTKILSDTHALWTLTSGQSCPKTHEFAFPFRSVYRAGGRTRPLPPSYKVTFLDSFCAQCIYRLEVRVLRKGSPLALWTGPERLDMIVHYRPRSSPPRPISYRSLLSSTSIGAASDEWHRIVSNIQTRSGSKIRPITCKMFIPSVQVYGFSDMIPYHVRFTGPLASFWALLGVYCSNNLLPSFTMMKRSMGPRVFLSREITVSIPFHKAKRICDHSEGTLRALPPQESSSDDVSPEDDISIDYEGEVRCYGNIDSPGFVTDDLVVQDFIVISWVPEPLPAPFLPFRKAHQIELVTDSWRDRFHL